MCQFTAKNDIIRSMLHSIATDNVWNALCWKGSDTKISFITQLKNIHSNIKGVALETFSHKDSNYFDGRIKTFLRHTTERIRRTDHTSNKEIEL